MYDKTQIPDIPGHVKSLQSHKFRKETAEILKCIKLKSCLVYISLKAQYTEIRLK